ncbi:hypothetical protein ACXYII_001536, partial [Campylobacter coli]
QTIETKNKTIQENLSQINNLNQTIETKNKTIQNKDDLLNFQAQYGTAKSRIQNQLSYKLGQTMIVNSKSFFRLFVDACNIVRYCNFVQARTKNI